VAIDGWRATCEFVFWYYLAANLLLDLKRQRVVLWSLVGVAALVALYGVYQYIIKVPIPPQWVDQAELGVRTRVFSFIGSPNILGSYLVLTIPIAVALFQTTKAIRPRIILSGCLLLMLACLVFTFSRGAWLAFAVAAIIYALLQDRRILILLLAGAIMLPVLSPSVAGRIEYAFSSQYLQSSAKGGRVVRWQMALDRLATHPLVGVGLGRFGGATAARFDVPGNYYVDNYFMKLTVEMGLIGLAAFIWLLLNVLRLLAGLIRKTARDPARFPLACAIAAGVIGVIAHNGVENVFEVPMMQALFWGLLGLAARLSLAPAVEPNAIKAKV
jgi:O-antigen ligase